MSKPTYSSIRYNEIGDPLFFLDYYDELTSTPFNKIFKGYPIYFSSFIDQRQYFDEVFDYLQSTFYHDKVIDSQTLYMLIERKLDRILWEIDILELECIPNYYFNSANKFFRIDEFRCEKDILDNILPKFDSKIDKNEDWFLFIQIIIRYYFSYREIKFEKMFPFKVVEISKKQYLSCLNETSLLDHFFDLENRIVSFWKLKHESISLFFTLDIELKVVTYFSIQNQIKY